VHSTVLAADDWRPRARAHEQRVDQWVQPHLERRRHGVAHPVHDFLFTYYSLRPAQLRRWSRGFAERGAPLRQRLIDECERLLAVAG
jgi:hypothetical protein